MIPKNCLFCSSFCYAAELPSWSDVTPGSDMLMYCSQGVWDLEDEEGDIRDLFAKAIYCEMFELDAWVKDTYTEYGES